MKLSIWSKNTISSSSNLEKWKLNIRRQRARSEARLRMNEIPPIYCLKTQKTVKVLRALEGWLRMESIERREREALQSERNIMRAVRKESLLSTLRRRRGSHRHQRSRTTRKWHRKWQPIWVSSFHHTTLLRPLKLRTNNSSSRCYNSKCRWPNSLLSSLRQSNQ